MTARYATTAQASPMTVAELIDALKRLEPDAVVMVRDHNSFRRAPIARLADGESEVTIVPWGKIYDPR